jgi:hypothetical protein
MKQTAVEWMANELLYLDNEYDMKLIDKNEYQAKRKQIIEQAKAMEKEQIIEAYETAMETDIYNEPLKIGKDYFNQTFKSE